MIVMLLYRQLTALNVFFTEDDYRAAESSQNVPVRVAKDNRIATSLTVTVNPLTVMQAEEQQESIMTLMPDDNPFSPNRAGIYRGMYAGNDTKSYPCTIPLCTCTM